MSLGSRCVDCLGNAKADTILKSKCVLKDVCTDMLPPSTTAQYVTGDSTKSAPTRCRNVTTAPGSYTGTITELDSTKSLVFSVSANASFASAHIAFFNNKNPRQIVYEVVIGPSRTRIYAPIYSTKFIDEIIARGILKAYPERSIFWIQVDAKTGLVRVGVGISVGQLIIAQWKDPAPKDVTHYDLMTGFGTLGYWKVCTAGGDQLISCANAAKAGACNDAIARGLCCNTCLRNTRLTNNSALAQDDDARFKAAVQANKVALMAAGLPGAAVDKVQTCADATQNSVGLNFCTFPITKALVAPLCPTTCNVLQPIGAHTLVSHGADGLPRHCTSAKKCSICHGDCDVDEDCAPGLKCFQRTGSSLVPGCKSGGKGDVHNVDFCYSPVSPTPSNVQGSGSASALSCTDNTDPAMIAKLTTGYLSTCAFLPILSIWTGRAAHQGTLGMSRVGTAVDNLIAEFVCTVPDGRNLCCATCNAVDGLQTGSGQFGSSVALSADGSMALVGAPGTVSNTSRVKSVFSFTRVAGAWKNSHLPPVSTRTQGRRGVVVALSADGGTALVGAPGDDDKGFEAGAAYVYTRTPSANSGGNTEWKLVQKLLAVDGSVQHRFGYSVALSSDGATALVGAPGYDNTGVKSGAAYIFVNTASGGTWSHTDTLVAKESKSDDAFGMTVALSSDGMTALISVPNDDDHGTISGAAYIFIRVATSWEERAKLASADSAPIDVFGFSAALSADGSTALVSAVGDEDHGPFAGSVYLFSVRHFCPSGQFSSASGKFCQLCPSATGFAGANSAEQCGCALERCIHCPPNQYPFHAVNNISRVVEQAIGRWDFRVSLQDLAGQVVDVVIDRRPCSRSLLGLRLNMDGRAWSRPSRAMCKSIGYTKTMAAWVTLHKDGWTDKGGIIGIEGEPCSQCRPHWDAIVYRMQHRGSRKQREVWSAESAMSSRSPDFTHDGVVSETAHQKVFIAVTYSHDTVQIYRNGVKYGTNFSYVGSAFYKAGECWVIFGPYYSNGGRSLSSKGGIDGVIHSAFLWNKSLTAVEVMEVYKTTADLAPDECLSCPDGMSSLRATSVHDCKTINASGSLNLCPAGSWGLDASNCMPCTPSERCPGGELCLLGYTGTACANCDVDRQGPMGEPISRYFSYRGTCYECTSATGLISIALACLILGISIRLIWELTRSPHAEHNGSTPTLVRHGSTIVDSVEYGQALFALRARFAALVTVTFSHIQLSVLFFSLPSIPWPVSLRKLCAYLANIFYVDFAGIVRPECQDEAPDDLGSMFAAKFAIKQGMFWLVFGTIFFMFIVARCNSKTITMHHAYNTMVALFSLFFLVLVQSCANIFDCSHHGAYTKETKNNATLYTPGSCQYASGNTDSQLLAVASEQECDNVVIMGATAVDTWTHKQRLKTVWMVSTCSSGTANITEEECLRDLNDNAVRIPARYSMDQFPDMTCWSSEGWWMPIAIYAAFALLVVLVVVPSYLYNQLHEAKREDMLLEHDTKAKLGWLFLRYDYHCCTWYEFALMGRKASLLLASMLLSATPYIMCSVSFTILATSLALHFYMLPFNDHQLDKADKIDTQRHYTNADKLEGISLSCELIIVGLSGYFIYLGPSHQSQHSDSVLYIAVLGIILVCALLPVVLTAHYIYVDYFRTNVSDGTREESSSQSAGGSGETSNPIHESDEIVEPQAEMSTE
eukprot:SAG25_NODE_291_length_10320_cov_2.259219_7_plen_1686_part_00